MQINGSFNTVSTQTPLPSRDQNRLDEQPSDRARKQPEPSRQQTDQQTVEISEAARLAAAEQQVVATNRGEESQNNYQYYPSDQRENLTSSQQKALQAYDNTQQLGREADASGEFLSGVDIFV